MSKYPIIILGENLEETQNICREFVRQNLVDSIERKGQAIYKFTLNEKEYWIMHKGYYVEWCKGRTYWKNGKLMHSGYMESME